MKVNFFRIHHHIQDLDKKDCQGSTGGDGELISINLSEHFEENPSINIYHEKPGSLLAFIWPLTTHDYKPTSLIDFFITEGMGYNFGIVYRNLNPKIIKYGLNKEEPPVISNFANYVSHVPVRQPEFMPMLYFSAITIATIGFGDIVPINPIVSMMVLFESILGGLFLGLFIALFSSYFKNWLENPDFKETGD